MKRNSWSPYNFTPLTNKLVELKFKCLHCGKFKRNEITIDAEDVKERFKKMNITYGIKNGTSNTKPVARR